MNLIGLARLPVRGPLSPGCFVVQMQALCPACGSHFSAGDLWIGVPTSPKDDEEAAKQMRGEAFEAIVRAVHYDCIIQAWCVASCWGIRGPAEA